MKLGKEKCITHIKKCIIKRLFVAIEDGLSKTLHHQNAVLCIAVETI
jgi:hypothetical protein